jgi:hypothetical protein
LNALDAAIWIHSGLPYIRAYLDPPKSLEELQQAALTPRRGYDKHHIVEKTPAARGGFPESLIEGQDNLVLVPTLKHWQITAWYMTKNKEFSGETPREYLRNSAWSERVHVGHSALVKFGILKQ